MLETIPDKELQGFSAYNTITIQFSLAHAIGTNETIVFNALVSKYFYYRSRNKLTEDGYFMVSESDLCESTTISGKPLTRYMKNIEAKGLIKQELRGMPARKYVYIVRDDKLLMELLNDGAKTEAEIHSETTEAHFWGDEENKETAKEKDGVLSLFNDRHKIYVNRPLAHSIGLESAVAWAVIVTKYFQCQRYGTLRDDGSFYITEADFENLSGYKRRKQKAAIDKLIELGFIKTSIAGVPAKRYFHITVTSEKLNSSIKNGMDTIKKVYSMTSEAAERRIREKEIAEMNRTATAEEVDEYIASKMGQHNGENQFVQNGGTRLSQTNKQDRTNGSSKFVQNGGTSVDKLAEHTTNLNIYNPVYSQSVYHDTECTEKTSTDGQTDRLSSHVNRMSYNQMLSEINSTFADDAELKGENDLSLYDEEDRKTQSCEIPYSLKNDRRAFKAALQYLCAYSYRFSDNQDEYLINFVDSVIDCITELVTSNNSHIGKRVYHYYEIIDNLNEIIHNITLADWLLLFKKKWIEIYTDKQRNGDPIKKQRSYMKPFIYDFLSEYKMENVYTEFL